MPEIPREMHWADVAQRPVQSVWLHQSGYAMVSSLSWRRVTSRCPGQAGLKFHSDQGSQYASQDFKDVLTEFGFTASMSRRGNC